jgi:hypothetical protein
MPTSTASSATLEKYHTMIRTENGKKVINAKDILSLSWQEYAELATMHNLPQVQHIHVEDFSTHSPLYWVMKDLSMKQTILLWLTCSALLIGTSINNPHKILPATMGFMTWVPIEYGYHRFIGHMPVVNDLTKRANFYLHGKHHFAPADLDHVLLPPAVIFIAAAVVYQFIFSAITHNPEIAIAFSILHYLLYDTMHYAMHNYSLKEASQTPIIGSVLTRIWGNHQRHHKEPERNFLVTTGGLFKNLPLIGKVNTPLSLSDNPRV